MKRMFFIVLLLFFNLYSCNLYTYTSKPTDEYVLKASQEAIERVLSNEKIIDKAIDIKKVDGFFNTTESYMFVKSRSYVAIIEFVATNSLSLSDIVAASKGSSSKLEFAYSLFNKYGDFKAGDFRLKCRTQLEFIKSEKGWIIANADSLKIVRIRDDIKRQTL